MLDSRHLMGTLRDLSNRQELSESFADRASSRTLTRPMVVSELR
jgi:hypothetical protein